MYSTCLFCHRPLGSNDVLESFPVGRRLAFDQAKGRLWVVCRRCGRWSLSPLEERWEAIEQCERLFGATRPRASTENIGLARVADGTDLVRIGEPERPELAAWRYGDQLGRRRRRNIAFGAAAVTATPLLAAGVISGGLAVAAAILVAQLATVIQLHRRGTRGVISKVRLADGSALTTRAAHLPTARLVRPIGIDDPSAWALYILHDAGEAELRGADALRTASRVLASVNGLGARDRTIQQAVQRLEHAGDADRLYARIAATPGREPSFLKRAAAGATPGARYDPPGTLRSLPIADRLALEMATHEETERRALDGELASLEAVWRDAEEIAAIADGLLVPPAAEELVERERPRQ